MLQYLHGYFVLHTRLPHFEANGPIPCSHMLHNQNFLKPLISSTIRILQILVGTFEGEPGYSKGLDI